MKQALPDNQFGVCVANGSRRNFIWFQSECKQNDWLSRSGGEAATHPVSDVEWVGHVDDLVHTRCLFSKRLHKEFYQMDCNVEDVADGCVSEMSIAEFYQFLNEYGN